MRNYNLGFISDENIYKHVKETVMRYSASIDLEAFNKNIIDPIKLTFDSKVYGRTMEEVIASECMRQMDKSNNNHIGYFHQNLFRYAGNGWTVPEEGFDVVNEEKHIFSVFHDNPFEMKRKNKIKLMIKMLGKVLTDEEAVCYIVDTSKHIHQEESWSIEIDKQICGDERIRYISIPAFYDKAFCQNGCYQNVLHIFPMVLEDVLYA